MTWDLEKRSLDSRRRCADALDTSCAQAGFPSFFWFYQLIYSFKRLQSQIVRLNNKIQAVFIYAGSESEGFVKLGGGMGARPLGGCGG